MSSAKAARYVGVDVGGTNITCALVEPSGAIVARHRARTPRTGTPRHTLDMIVGAVAKLLAQAEAEAPQVQAIGLGIPGLVDPEQGRVIVTPNMNLTGLKVVPPLAKKFGIPVVLDNDVNLGTLGEQWLGAARKADSAVGIFVGTGIGGGLICDGQLVRGARHAAGEIGHMVMEVDGPLCGCGNKGCLEALASRSAIERDIRDAVAAGRKTILTDLLGGDLSSIRSKALQRALDAEDELVSAVMRRAARFLGFACLSVRHLLDPEVIVLGGGVMEACGSFVMPVVEEVMDSDSLTAGRESARVVRSELGDDAVVLGAVALAQAAVGSGPEAEKATEYPAVSDYQFGRLTVGGEVYRRDVYILVDGKVKKRKKALAKEVYGTSHKIGPEELSKVCEGRPDVLVIGSGEDGQARLTDEARGFLRERGITVRIAVSAQAAEKYNRAEGRKAALFHLTC